ncbi:AABR07027872.1 [Phodopus roborovskii]|uniref:AABR07027872.1 protein n=1 Tax=Phodopus roborovskii TaxID=109678 RepID=A0AAU9ZSD8_PHORO|nr:AABR07027872.1 [Phodopus roborovskii]
MSSKFEEGSDFCRSCKHCDSLGWIKVFAEGTKVIIIPSDKRFEADISPKPTIFLPSVAETNLYKAGTYLCLLEKFFPDVIRVYWKEKDGDKTLESQEGNTLKTNDTYMTFSWLTVTEKSMHKAHRCIVKHENNKNGVNQEISFPPIKKVAMSTVLTTCWHENDVQQLQLTSTLACYTYLLLLLKSMTYLAMVSFFLFGRTDICGNKKKS